jgi:hypothetical protein
MATYRAWVYTPGPVLLALLLVSAAAVAGLGRARRCGDRIAIGLLAGACVTTLVTGAALSGFSWRYQLPQVPLLPMAGALAVAALLRGAAPGRPAPPPPLRPLDRVATFLEGLPAPAPARSVLRSATASGRLQVVVAALLAVVVAAVVAWVGTRSGWLIPQTAWLAGGALGVLVASVLLVARARSRSPALKPGS